MFEGNGKIPSGRSVLLAVSIQPKVAIAKFIGKMQKKKSGIMKSGLDDMPLFLLDDLLSVNQSRSEQNMYQHFDKFYDANLTKYVATF